MLVIDIDPVAVPVIFKMWIVRHAVYSLIDKNMDGPTAIPEGEKILIAGRNHSELPPGAIDLRYPRQPIRPQAPKPILSFAAGDRCDNSLMDEPSMLYLP
jgi:hypothetical protein